MKLPLTRIYFCLVICIISNSFFCQENKLNIQNYKTIESKEFLEIVKNNPKISVTSIFENGTIFSKKEQDSLIRISKIQNFIPIYLKDTVNDQLLILNRELNKDEIKIRKSNYKSKLKEEKLFRDNLDGTQLSELNLEDLNGLKTNLDSLKGKVIVLNFWFTQCKPCVAEFPKLDELIQRYKSQPVAFFAVTWNNKQTIDKFLATHKLDFNIIPNGKWIIDKFKIPYYPYNIIINKNRKIEYINDVLVLDRFKKLKNKIDKSLKE